jgi:hypothetical protein
MPGWLRFGAMSPLLTARRRGARGGFLCSIVAGCFATAFFLVAMPLSID